MSIGIVAFFFSIIMALMLGVADTRHQTEWEIFFLAMLIIMSVYTIGELRQGSKREKR